MAPKKKSTLLGKAMGDRTLIILEQKTRKKDTICSKKQIDFETTALFHSSDEKARQFHI